MSSSRHISRVSSARFEEAIREALAKIVSGGEKFDVMDVIRLAKYEDGSKVGQTTIYAKSSEGKRVHDKLLGELRAASARSRRTGGAKAANVGVEVESADALRKQLVEQESRILELESALASVNLALRGAQEDGLLALLTLSGLTQGAVLRVVRPLKELEGVIERPVVEKIRTEAKILIGQCRRLTGRQ